jgi:ATPase family associated with various cellular activities (AAA)
MASSLELKASTPSVTPNPYLRALLPALQRLDRLLDWAVAAMQPGRGSESSAPFRGLYISREEVARLLARQPGENQFGANLQIPDDSPESQAEEHSALEWMIQAFGLSRFDADVVLLALAPELDLRYEKIYAYLQDDITRRRPTVELVLNLLCSSASEKLDRRIHFSPQSPLIRHGLVQVAPDPNHVEPSFLAYFLKLDSQIARLLLGQAGLEPRLTPFCELIKPAIEWNQLLLDPHVRQALPKLAAQAIGEGKPLRLYFQGLHRTEKQEVVEALAGKIGAPLLAVRLDRLAERSSMDWPLRLVLREARTYNAILYIAEFDDLKGQDAWQRKQDLLEIVKQYEGITVIAGRNGWIPGATVLGLMRIVLDVPDFEERCIYWKSQLADLGTAVESQVPEKLAARFRLSAGQIREAVTTASASSRWRAACTSSEEGFPGAMAAAAPDLADLSAAARTQCGHELASLAHKIEPRYGWCDIVLPDDQTNQLREVCSQAEYRHIVYGEWGFDRKLSLGKGLNVLFSGPPGTGKTMAAEVIARELGLDLYRIDLSQVVSKYIGETEKNLDRIFTAAENSNAILFFDEADALFGKRSEVRDSHDRYANIEISYLLQKMEEYQGISILATNLRQHLDEAFVRRLQAIIEFPFPTEEYRRKIWEGVFPREAPLAGDVKFEMLAREVRLAGGNIKNMALAAAFYAASDRDSIRMKHLIQAAHREHQKLGRSWTQPELLKPQIVR